MIASGNSISPNGNRRTLAILGALVFGMVGLSYASVPLYELFAKSPAMVAQRRSPTADLTRLSWVIRLMCGLMPM